jgi:hypothetical protein
MCLIKNVSLKEKPDWVNRLDIKSDKHYSTLRLNVMRRGTGEVDTGASMLEFEIETDKGVFTKALKIFR